jgi:hypothetical protein
MITGKAPQAVNASQPHSVKRVPIGALDSRWGREDTRDDTIDRMHEAFTANEEAA